MSKMGFHDCMKTFYLKVTVSRSCMFLENGGFPRKVGKGTQNIIYGE